MSNISEEADPEEQQTQKPKTLLWILVCAVIIAASITLYTKRRAFNPLLLPDPPNINLKSPDGSSFINSSAPIANLLPADFSKNDISLLIEKSQFRLTVYYQSKPIKSYPIVLGTNPVDDKRYEGDRCTPEGSFQLAQIRNHAKWSKFMLINYPTKDSYKKHTAAKQNNQIPQDSTVGSAIGIHGTPPNSDSFIDRRVNWTAGCISLKRQDVEELAKVVKVGTPLKIEH